MSIKDTDRDLSKLAPNFKKKVEAFLKEVGDKIFVTEAYRSQERQNYLFSLGRTISGNQVTWTLNSKHTEGLAIDIAFRGDVLYPKSMYVWGEIGSIAKKYGIDWGYDLWETDKPHFQDNGKEFTGFVKTPVGDYRKLFGHSTIKDTEAMGKAIQSGTPDECVASVEVVAKRVAWEILQGKI